MKGLIVIFPILIGFSSFAQKAPTEKKELPISYECSDSTKFNKDKSIIQLFGNASLKADLIQITHADNILFNGKTNEVVVTGKFEYVMNGVVQVTAGPEHRTLRYKLGDKTAYLN